MDNIKLIQNYFQLLGIKYTFSYLRKRLDVIPHANSMLGLTALLSEYNITVRCIRISETDLHGIDLPFITIKNGEFIVVEHLNKRDIKITRSNGKSSIISYKNLFEGWNRVILIGIASEKSHELDYEEHFQEERIAKTLKFVVWLSILILFIGGLLCSYDGEVVRNLFVLLSIGGIYISYLLLQKDLDIPNPVSDRICSLIKESSCDEVTQSKGAEVLGMFHLSEIGGAYFIVNLISLLLTSSLF